MTINKLVAGAKGASGNSTGADVAAAVNGLIDGNNFLIKSNKPRVMFIGDSLTGSGTSPLSESGLTFKYSSGLSQLAAWVKDPELDSLVAANYSGQLKTDGDGTLQFAYFEDVFGEKIDVSAGGFFAIPSGNGVRCFVKVVKSGQPSIARLDSLTFIPIRTSVQVGGLNTFAEYIKCNVTSDIDVFNAGITGDTVEGVSSRWRQAFDLFNPDYIFLMIGTNNQPADNVEAFEMFTVIQSAITSMLEKVKAVFVGGLFPRGATPALQLAAMNYYSSLLRNFCQQNENLVYWDSYPYLVDSNSVVGTIKVSAFHTDNLHLMPLGAMVAAKPVVNALISSGLYSGIASNSRGINSDHYSLCPNSLFLGSGGTGSGSNGVTGVVPQNVTAHRNGGTQTMAISQEVDTFTQNKLLLNIAGSTTSGNYHELWQTAVIPVDLVNGKFKIKVAANVVAASGLQTFEFAAIGAGNSFAAYLNQGGRVISGVTSDTDFEIDYLSDAFSIPSGTATAQIRFRIGTTAGGSAQVLLREFSLIAVND